MKKHLTDLLQSNKKTKWSGMWSTLEILEMDKDEADLDIIKFCKQFVRKYGDFLNIEAKYSENIYYATDNFSVNSDGENIFKLVVEQNHMGADYKLACKTYNIYCGARHKHKRNLQALHKMLKRKAAKQKKMILLRNNALQKLNNSVQFVKQNTK